MKTKEIDDFLRGGSAGGEEGGRTFHREELAAAALLVECARVDGSGIQDDERDTIVRAVGQDFSLDAETAEALVAIATKHEDAVWHNHLFTATIRASFDEPGMLRVIRRLWEVALADHLIHPHELHLISRVARALGIEEQATREARAWMRERLGPPESEPRG